MKLMNCSCGSKYIVNKKHQLCQQCNWRRLHPNQQPKIYELKRSTIIPKTTYKIKQHSIKSKQIMKIDEQVYELVFNKHIFNNGGICQCEECGVVLNDEFRNEDGKIIERFKYSHILSKGAYPQYRHHIDNFNILCFSCHSNWEFNDRSKMLIYNKNQLIIQQILKK